jgi:hypothetical protein
VLNRKIFSKKSKETYMEWNYDTNGGDNLWHRSIEQTKFLIPMYENGRKINATYFGLASSF